MFARFDHVATFSHDYTRNAKFYEALFGLKTAKNYRPARAVVVSDGYVGMNIIPRRDGRTSGLDHFGIEVEDFERVQARAAEKYPAIVRPRQHIITRLNKQLAFLFDSLSQRDMLIASKTDRALLVDLISLIITQSCQFDELNSHMDSTMQRYHALSLMMVSVLPRLALSDEQKKQLEQILNSQDFVRGSATHSPLDFA